MANKGELVRFPPTGGVGATWSSASASPTGGNYNDLRPDTAAAPLSAGLATAQERRSLKPAHTVPLSFLGDPSLFLARPLHVVTEESAVGAFIAASYDLDLAGQGETEFDALDDLRGQVLELFVTLREMRANLPKHLSAKLAFLESLL